MKTIFLILLFLVMGVIFGFILARVLNFISEFILRKKTTKQAKEEKERQFFYVNEPDKPYNLADEIKKEQSKNKKGFFGIFHKKVKGGISQYGEPEQRSDESIVRKQIPDDTAKSKPESPASSPDSNTRGEQRSPNPPARGERGTFARNLFEKGKKFN